ncbi:MAG TPA: 16S rRNA (cytosine(967)-C(5))-methyltransferase RsmB [Solirubrobacteraceae bacterium]|nr:16S rRNA (cytosine(967)-C(5))-methyltransferase RsmB [Solirubrobacteraceae bacterium]
MSAPAPARACAYTVLRRVFEDGAYADLALRAAARELDARDRALAMRLAYGAIQRRGTLDHLIARLAERPVGRLDAPLLAALRLGLYELLYLRGAPDHAVVADAVELAKRAGRGHGLVNAVLRRAAREGGSLLAGLDDATPEQAAVAHSHPLWIARMWWEELGPTQARALLACDNEPAELALRANTLVTDASTLAAELRAPGGAGQAAGAAETGGTRFHPDPWLPEALVVEGPLDVYDSPLWRAGAFAAQSRAAMLPARVLGPRPGERVLDLCAAPGGKTTHLAALMEDRGEVVAVERDPRRAEELRGTVRRMRTGCVRVVVGDAAQPLGDIAEPSRDLAKPPTGPGGQHGSGFDRVLVDPPCSGLGTLQARADLRWRATPQGVAELVQVQRAILSNGAQAVRPGGVLVYSTCTISPSENERQISDFLESSPQFVLDDLSREPVLETPGGARGIGTPAMDGRAVLTLPHRDRTAGFFIARLRRVAER